MSGKRRIKMRRAGGVWFARCTHCIWSGGTRNLTETYEYAIAHQCWRFLGPSPLAEGTTIAAATSTTTVAARDPRPHASWWDYYRPQEVW